MNKQTPLLGVTSAWLTNFTIADINEIASIFVTVIIGIVTVYKMIAEKKNKNNE